MPAVATSLGSARGHDPRHPGRLRVRPYIGRSRRDRV